MALKWTVWVFEHESGPEKGRLGFTHKFLSLYSHAHDERELEYAAGSLLICRPLAGRHRVDRNAGPWRVAVFQHRQLMSIKGDGASLRRVVDVLPHPLEPRTTNPTKRCCMKTNFVHN